VITHLASSMDQHGRVTMACVKEPLRRLPDGHVWVLRPEAVTCTACRYKRRAGALA
jgi:hypothetical protein